MSKCSLSSYDAVIKLYLMPVNDTVSSEKVSVCLAVNWDTHLFWNEIGFDPNAQRLVSPTVSHTASLAVTPGVCVCVVMLDPYSRDEISQLNCSYQSRVPLFKNSDLSAYQGPDRCEESKSICGDEERWFRREEIHRIWSLFICTHKERVLSWVLTRWQAILIVFPMLIEQEMDGDSWGWSQLKSRWQVDLFVVG